MAADGSSGVRSPVFCEGFFTRLDWAWSTTLSGLFYSGRFPWDVEPAATGLGVVIWLLFLAYS